MAAHREPSRRERSRPAPSVTEYLTEYLESLADRALAAGTRARIEKHLRGAERDHGAALRDVPVEAWADWVRLVHARHAPASAAVRVRTVRAYLRWARLPEPACMDLQRETRRVTIAWRAALAEWVQHLRAGGAPATTIELRTRHLEQFAAQHPELGPWAVRRSQLIAWLAGNDHWMPETRYAHRSSLRGFYRWATDEGHVGVDPAARLPKVRRIPPEARPLPMAYLDAAADVADERLALMLLLAAGHGLRRGEIARIHSSDVLDPTRDEDRTGLVLLVHGKGGKTRRVPLSRQLGELIRGRAGYLFPGNDHGHLSPAWVGRLLSRPLPEGWTGHTARHLFATTAYHLHRDLFTVQELLGHASADTTRRYVQTDETAKRATVHEVTARLPARLRARYGA